MEKLILIIIACGFLPNMVWVFCKITGNVYLGILLKISAFSSVLISVIYILKISNIL